MEKGRHRVAQLDVNFAFFFSFKFLFIYIAKNGRYTDTRNVNFTFEAQFIVKEAAESNIMDHQSSLLVRTWSYILTEMCTTDKIFQKKEDEFFGIS